MRLNHGEAQHCQLTGFPGQRCPIPCLIIDFRQVQIKIICIDRVKYEAIITIWLRGGAGGWMKTQICLCTLLELLLIDKVN
jgi:hypothetical protein